MCWPLIGWIILCVGNIVANDPNHMTLIGQRTIVSEVYDTYGHANSTIHYTEHPKYVEYVAFGISGGFGPLFDCPVRSRTLKLSAFCGQSK